MGLTGALATPQKHPDSRQPVRASRVLARAGIIVRPASLDHGRALGSPSVLGPLAPSSLVHTRELGVPQASVPFPLDLLVIRGREAHSLEDPPASAPFYYLRAQIVNLPAGLEHDRVLGSAAIASTTVGTTSLVNTRTLGTPTVLSPLNPTPNALVRERLLGAVGVAVSNVPLPRSYGKRSLRGVARRALIRYER